MNAFLTRISAGLIALGALLYFLACNPANQNTNTTQNQNAAPNQNRASGNGAAKDLKPCDVGSAPGSHAQEIKKEMKNKMGSSLKKLLKDADNPNGTFTIDVQKASSGAYFEAFVRGEVSGDDNLKDLSNILNDFQGDSQCVRVVYFLPDSSAPSLATGFKWSSCEYPMVVCPTGECCYPTTTNSNTNMNTNQHTNSNSNGNSNSNANRP